MNGRLLTVGDLEARLGPTPGPVNLKVIDHLDFHARRWLAAAPLAFVGFGDAREVDVTLAGAAPGFAAASDTGRLCLPRAAMDDSGLARPGRGAGLLFLVPGLNETLRINGVVAGSDGEAVVIDVQECYAHCAKALLRSAFWQPVEDFRSTDVAAFLDASRFLALATADAGLHADVSPKGDPAGMLVHRFEDGIRFADRPGNRRTDSFRNILSQPRAAALLIVPGCTQVAIAQGAAEISSDPELCAGFAVQDKTPKLVTSLASPSVTLRESAALAAARPWASCEPPADIDPAEIFAAHVRLSKARGLHAALIKGAVSIPGLMRKGLEQDYKRNLY